MAWNPQEDAWLSGFTDGEGHFSLAMVRGRPVAAFVINLRVDDKPVLDELREAFGGCVFVARYSDSSRNPEARWNVVAKADLARVVRYFDRFPLRAKKAREYALWRSAVSAWCARGPAAYPEMQVLGEALQRGRVFDAEPESLPRSPDEALTLWSGYGDHP
jgi:hypothetical protein